MVSKSISKLEIVYFFFSPGFRDSLRVYHQLGRTRKRKRATLSVAALLYDVNLLLLLMLGVFVVVVLRP